MNSSTLFDEWGPWGRVAYGFLVRKAHYTIEQRGAWLSAWCMAGLATPHRGFVKLKPLVGTIGQKLTDFLIEEGDLRLDGDVVEFVGFEWAQAPLERGARAAKAYRERERERKLREDASSQHASQRVDITSPSYDDQLTRDDVSSSLSTYLDSSQESSTAETARAGGFEPGDPLDDFYLVSTMYPNSERMRSWVNEVAAAGPKLSDFGVVFRVEFERAHGNLRDAMKATKGRLSKMTEQARAARAARPYVPPEPPQARETTPVDEETARAGRAAWEALRTGLPRTPKLRGGLASRVGDLLPSLASSGSQEPSLTGAEGSDRKTPAVDSPGESPDEERDRRASKLTGSATPFESNDPVTEPGERMAEPARHNASTDGATGDSDG